VESAPSPMARRGIAQAAAGIRVRVPGIPRSARR
jgi:hypothetical protein